MSLYRNVLKRALSVTWYNKYLWFFGLFAGILGGVGKYEISLNRAGGNLEEGVYPQLAGFLNSEAVSNVTFSNLFQTFQNDPVTMFIVIGLFLILLILGLFMLWLSVVSQIALVNNSAEALRSNKKYSSLKLKDGVAAGMKNFWPVLGWNLIVKTLVYVLFAALSLPVIHLATTGSSSAIVNISYVVLFVVFLPAALILSLLLKYAVIYIVLKGKSFVDAWTESWRLFLRNWLVSLEMALILFVIQFLATIVLILAVLALIIPFLFFAFLVGGISASAFWIVMLVAMLLVLALTLLVGAAFATFQISSWTGLFLELTGKKGVLAKLIRLTQGKKSA